MPSTQDVAREHIEQLPVLVLAAGQSAGRGRSGAEWLTADRALAVSLAYRHAPGDDRPMSLLAGVAAVRSVAGARLKWPNDLLIGRGKAGGILVERSGDVTVIGLGLNLWWRSAPDGVGALFHDDPGKGSHLEIGACWGAEMIRLLDAPGWPLADYRAACETLGCDITWEPGGKGRAIDVGEDGALIVVTEAGRETLTSGAIRHVRPA